MLVLWCWKVFSLISVYTQSLLITLITLFLLLFDVLLGLVEGKVFYRLHESADGELVACSILPAFTQSYVHLCVYLKGFAND